MLDTFLGKSLKLVHIISIKKTKESNRPRNQVKKVSRKLAVQFQKHKIFLAM